MTDCWGVGVPDSAIVMLAQMMLTRMKLNGMRVDNRQDAIAVIKGLRTVSRVPPLTSIMKSAIGKKARETGFCTSCGKPLQVGELCRTVWTANDGEHIKCEGRTR
jgi:hypothetical protein